MKSVNTYLMFNGNCRAAVTFYAKALGVEAEIMTFADVPGQGSEADKDRIMHASLPKGSKTPFLMASDTMPNQPHTSGNNFSITINCESKEEIERLFKNMSEGGQVTMGLQDTFWGAHFGMLTDKFGVNWMFNYELPKG